MIEWIQAHPELKKHVLEAGKVLEDKLRHDQLAHGQRLQAEQAGDQVTDICTNHLAKNVDDIEFLFSLLSASAAKEDRFH